MPAIGTTSATMGTNGQPQVTVEQQLDQQFLKVMNDVNELWMSRQEFVNRFMDPRRNIDRECGYPHLSEYTPRRYRDIYNRDPIACRVVEIMPTECWKIQPSIAETSDEDNATKTPFEEAWDNLPKQICGGSWYKGDNGNPVWEILERIDVLSGIASYGVLFLGLDDGQNDLSQPVADFSDDPPGQAARQLLFIRAFDQTTAYITQLDQDENSARFGLPLQYKLYFGNPVNMGVQGTTPQTALIENLGRDVHWTRVVHIVDGLDTSEVIGIPRMQQVIDRLMDLQKLYGGSAEMYWKGAYPGLSFETQPTAAIPKLSATDLAAYKKQIESYENRLQRYLQTVGFTVKSLAPQVVDPTPQITSALNAICIKLGVPLRIFMGSEMAQLASAQDKENFAGRVRERRMNYLIPKVVVKFIDHLIKLRVLPVPEQFLVTWENEDTTTPLDQSNILLHRAQALAQYVTGNCESVMAPADFLIREMGYDEEDVEEMLENAMEAVEENQERQLEYQQQQGEILGGLGGGESAGEGQGQGEGEGEGSVEGQGSGEGENTSEEEGQQKGMVAAEQAGVLNLDADDEDVIIDNAWSDEARAAALEVRQRSKGTVQMRKDGGVKLTAPKSTEAAKAMIGTMRDLFDKSAAGVESTKDLGENHPDKVRAQLLHLHMANQFERAGKMSLGYYHQLGH